MQPLIEYFKAVRAEMAHVTWPSRNQAIAYTALVVALSLFVAFLLGGFDYLFTFILSKLLAAKG